MNDLVAIPASKFLPRGQSTGKANPLSPEWTATRAPGDEPVTRHLPNRLRIGFLIAAISCFPSVVPAQNGPTANQYEQGIIPNQTYDSDGVGSVNLANGNLVLQIPLVDYKQLGTLPDYVLNLSANSKNWSIQTAWTGDPNNCTLGSCSAGGPVKIREDVAGGPGLGERFKPR